MGVEALIFGSVLSAGIGAASAAHTQKANAAAQRDVNDATMEFNHNEALLAREFTERMASTAHQREVSDLKAAGLNPVLSANSGSSVTASPVASVNGLSAYRKDNVMNQFVNSALEGIKVSNDLKRAQASDKSADAALKNAQAHEKDVELHGREVSVKEAKANAEIREIDNSISIAMKDYEIRKNLAEASIEEKHAAIDKFMAEIDVSKAQADKIGLEVTQLKRYMRYGRLLMDYLPSDARDVMFNHLTEFVVDNPNIIKDTVGKFDDNWQLSSSDSSSIVPRVLAWMKGKGWIGHKEKE